VKRVLACCLALCLYSSHPSQAASPPADQVLPSTTRAMVSIPRVEEFREKFSETQLGKLAADPLMKPFAEDMRSQIQDRLVKNQFQLNLTWEDVVAACGGELALASIQPDGDAKQHAAVLFIDVTGREEALARLLEESSKQLEARGAKRRVADHGGTEVVIQDLPRQRGETAAVSVVRFVANDTLVVGDHEGVCLKILDRLKKGDVTETLSQLPRYQATMDRVKKEAGDMKPQAQWYIDPFGYAEVARASQKGPKKRRKDMLAILKSQGFGAVEAAGGYVHLATGEQEVLHRTFVYAPGSEGKESRFQLAARMLDFPNDADWTLPNWVPRELATLARFQLNVGPAFEHSKTLVDAVAGDEGFFEALLTSLKDDPNGPKIDVRKDFVAHLNQRILVMSDHVLPITPQSERLLVAIEVTDEEAVRETVRRTLLTDPSAKKQEVAGVEVWEIINEKSQEEEDLEFSVDVGDPLAETPEEEEEPHLPNSAVTVAKGHFMVSTHVDFLQRVLRDLEAEDHLPKSDDYQRVQTHLEKLSASSDSLRYFSRTDEEYQPAYELIRAGKMPESESLLGRVLNRLWGPEDKDVLRKQRIDGSNLPEFEAIRAYLGPAGGYMRSEPNGWYVTGVLLNKQAQNSDSSEASAVTAEREDSSVRSE
jgi:hypothetical protein